ncbi:acyl dehydratase [Chloroflexota bacterium]
MAWETKYWDDVSEGEDLPHQTQEITRASVIAMAFAARDFYPPVHFDHEAAQEAGLNDVNVNIIATGGLVSKYLTDWSGPKGKLKNLQYQLGLSVYPGDILTYSGNVIRKSADGDENVVDVEYKLSVAAGVHAWGAATLVLPDEGRH